MSYFIVASDSCKDIDTNITVDLCEDPAVDQ